jgi:hypothetical protein
VTASPDGELRLLYHPCRADRPAETVQLLIDDGDTPGNGNDTLLWEATTGSRPIVASDVMTFELGSVPTGYSETVKLHAPEPARRSWSTSPSAAAEASLLVSLGRRSRMAACSPTLVPRRQPGG